MLSQDPDFILKYYPDSRCYHLLRVDSIYIYMYTIKYHTIYIYYGVVLKK